MTKENQSDVKYLAKKIGSGVAIALVGWTASWVFTISTAISINTERLNNTFKLGIANQENVQELEGKIVGIEKHVVGILKDITQLQKEQVEISRQQSKQMEEFQYALTSLQSDVNYIKAYESAEDVLKTVSKKE